MQVRRLLAAMPSLAQLEVSNSSSDRGPCSEAVWWAWWLKGLLPESVLEVTLDFKYDRIRFAESVVRGGGEGLEHALGRLALTAGAVSEAAGDDGWGRCWLGGMARNNEYEFYLSD